MPFLKGGTPMYFTEGQLREYERIMQEKPGYNRRVIKTMKERDCRNCKHFDESCNRIGSSVRCSGHDEYWNNEHVSNVPTGTTKELEKVEKLF